MGLLAQGVLDDVAGAQEGRGVGGALEGGEEGGAVAAAEVELVRGGWEQVGADDASDLGAEGLG